MTQPNLSSIQWTMMLLMVMIQSSMGMALSLSAIWSYNVKLLIIVGSTEAAIFHWFSMTALGLNLLVFSVATSTLSMQCMKVGASMHREIADQAENRRRGYGAMGFSTVA